MRTGTSTSHQSAPRSVSRTKIPHSRDSDFYCSKFTYFNRVLAFSLLSERHSLSAIYSLVQPCVRIFIRVFSVMSFALKNFRVENWLRKQPIDPSSCPFPSSLMSLAFLLFSYDYIIFLHVNAYFFVRIFVSFDRNSRVKCPLSLCPALLKNGFGYNLFINTNSYDILSSRDTLRIGVKSSSTCSSSPLFSRDSRSQTCSSLVGPHHLWRSFHGRSTTLTHIA